MNRPRPEKTSRRDLEHMQMLTTQEQAMSNNCIEPESRVIDWRDQVAAQRAYSCVRFLGLNCIISLDEAGTLTDKVDDWIANRGRTPAAGESR